MTQTGFLQQASFSSGEVTPSLYGRVDLQRYNTALSLCKNFFVKAEGGVSKRPGTKYISNTRYIASGVKLIPFLYSTTQTYIIEMGDQYLRFFENGEPILTGVDIQPTGVADDGSGNAVYTLTAHGLSNGDNLYPTTIPAGEESVYENRILVVTDVTANTFKLMQHQTNALTQVYVQYGAGLTANVVFQEPYQISSPYVGDDVDKVKVAQSADVMYLAHEDYEPRKLSRTALGPPPTFTLTTISFNDRTSAPTISAGTWNYQGTSGSDLYPNGYGNDVYVVTAVSNEKPESLPSAQRTVTRDVNWAASGAAAEITLTITGGSGTGIVYNVYKRVGGVFLFIGTTSTGTFEDRNYQPSSTANSPPEDNDPFASSNYPSTVTFFEDRLCWAASTTDPQTVWTSQSGDYENFSVSEIPVSSDALEFTINSRQVNKIEHMVPLEDLLLLTSSSIWAASGAGENEPLAPDSIRATVQSYEGAEDAVAPITIGDSILFVEDKGQAVRDLHYEFATDKYQGNDLSVMSRHLLEGKTINSWAWSRVPNGLLWMVKDDGDVLGLTYLREHDVRGWSQHDFGGTVQYLCTVPEGGEDYTYMIITRAGDGQSFRYIERIESRFFTDQNNAWFVDGGYRPSSTSQGDTVINGLWHLEGQSVVALVEGNVVDNITVSNGTVTLPNALTANNAVVTIGLAFTAEMETLDMNVASDGGALHPQRRQTSKVYVRTRDTRGLFAAESQTSTDLNEIKERTYTPGTSIGLQSGVFEIGVDSTWERAGKVYIQSPYPLPAEITSIMPLMTIGK